MDLYLKAAAILALLYVGLSLFNVPWRMRLRIIGAITIGTFLVGMMGWPLVAPQDPRGAVTFYGGQISFFNIVICMILAFIAGGLSYFVSFPYGKMVGLLAVPSGMAFWAFQSGNMRSLLLTNAEVQQRLAMYSFLKWESLVWLILVVCGALGAMIANRFFQPKEDPLGNIGKLKFDKNKLPLMVGAIIATVIITRFMIILFAQDVKYQDSQFGSVIGQPGNRQIAFAVFASFLIAGFVTKMFLDANYIFTFLAGPILLFFIIQTICNQTNLSYMHQNWSIVYFPNALCAILPIQIVPFSAIGAITGYWIAVRYKGDKTEEKV